MATTFKPHPAQLDKPRSAWDKRLDEISWGLFLLMTGGLWLLPGDRIPSGAWLLATGALLLGINGVRYVKRVPINVFTALLGALALSGGLAERAGLELPLLAIAIAATGVLLLLKPLVRPRG